MPLAKLVLLHLLQFIVGEVDDGAVAFLCPFDLWCIFIVGIAGIKTFAASPLEEPLESGEVAVDCHALLVPFIDEPPMETEKIVGVDEVELGVAVEIGDEFSEAHKSIHCALAPRLVVLAFGDELGVGGEEFRGGWLLWCIARGGGAFGSGSCESLA